MRQAASLLRGKRTVVPLLSILSPCAGLWGFASLTRGSAFPVHSFLLIPCFAVLVWAGGRLFRLRDHSLRNRSYGLGLLFAWFLCLGYQMRFHDGLGGWQGLGIVCLMGLGFAPVAAYGAVCLYRALERAGQSQKPENGGSRGVFWIYAGVLFLCWLPVFLAYYPGLFAYDVMFQIPQVTSGEYSTFQPLFHTLLLGAFYRLGGALGSHTLGMALYTLCQMATHALILAYALAYLAKLGCRRGFRIFCLLIFSFSPVHSMLAISMIKDNLWVSLLLLATILFHQAYREPARLKDWRFVVRLLLVMLPVCLLRNNGVFSFLALGVCVPFLLKDAKARNRILTLILSGLLLFGGSSFLLSKALGAKPGPIKETLSVPLQQMGRVYSLHQESLDAETLAKIEEFIPGVYAYVPTFADHIKAFANVGAGNLREFLTLWVRLLAEYPWEYVDAFLFNCQGYWFVDDLTQASHYGTGLEGRQGYLLSDTKEGFGVEHISLFPPLETLYENLFSANEYQRIPVFAQAFSLASHTWLLAFLLMAALYRKRGDILLCAALLVGTLASLLLGPCAIVRYQYPLMLICPILLGLLFGTPAAGRSAGRHITQSEEGKS